MLSYAEHPLRKAMAEARDAGVEKADMISMVTDVYNAPQVNNAEPASAAGEVIYDELPDGLIDLRAAAEKHGCSLYRLRQWAKRGHLPPQGRLKSPAPGGGVVIVDDESIRRLLLDPPRSGRPKTVPTD